MLPEDYATLATFKDTFLVVGLKHDGYGSWPTRYLLEYVTTNSAKIVHELKSFKRFKVFEIKEHERDEEWWTKYVEVYEKNKEEDKERALYEQLKKKFENK